MSVDPSKYSTIVNVRNIDEDMTNEKLKDMFAKYGTLTSCKIMTSGNLDFGRFAYVAFEDPDAAEEAIIELNGQEIAEGRRISLRRTCKKLLRPSNTRSRTSWNLNENVECLNHANPNRGEIFVKYLDPTITTTDLHTIFVSFGTIVTSKVIMENGRSKGYGFVTFLKPEYANRAVEAVNGRVVMGKSLYVALARGTDHRLSARVPEFARRLPYFSRNAGTYRTVSTSFTDRGRLRERLADLRASNVLSVRPPLAYPWRRARAMSASDSPKSVDSDLDLKFEI